MHIIEDEKDKDQIIHDQPAVDSASNNTGKQTNTSASGTPRLSEQEKARIFAEYQQMVRRNAFPNWIDILAMVGIIIGSMFAAVAAMGLIRVFVKEPDLNVLGLIGYVIQFVLSIFFIVLLQRHRGMKKNLLHLNIAKTNPPLVLWGVVLIFVLSIVLEPLLELFPARYLDNMDQAIGTGGWAILLTVVCAPILEELLFRGLILGSIREKRGKVLNALVVSSVIFAVMHINVPQQAVNAFFVGLVLGYIYIRTESLAAVILIHAINNGLAYVQMELFDSSAEAVSMRGMIGNDVVYYIIYGFSLALLVVSAVMMVRALNRQKAAAGPLHPDGALQPPLQGEAFEGEAMADAAAPVENEKKEEKKKTSSPPDNNKV